MHSSPMLYQVILTRGPASPDTRTPWNKVLKHFPPRVIQVSYFDMLNGVVSALENLTAFFPGTFESGR